MLENFPPDYNLGAPRTQAEKNGARGSVAAAAGQISEGSFGPAAGVAEPLV